MQQLALNVMLETTHDHIKNWYANTGGKIHDVTLPEMDKKAMLHSVNVVDKKMFEVSQVANVMIGEELMPPAVAEYVESLVDLVISVQVAIAAMGLPYDDLLAHKVQVNMQKRVDAYKADGSLIKPEGYKEADMLGGIRTYVKSMLDQKLKATLPANNPDQPV